MSKRLQVKLSLDDIMEQLRKTGIDLNALASNKDEVV